MRRIQLGVLVAAELAIYAAGCSSPTGPTPCQSGVSVSVGTGLTPRFTWVPACRVQALSVLIEASRPEGNVVWDIVKEDNAGISSGIMYGVMPTGATVRHSAEPLVAGQSYNVRVYVSEFEGDHTRLRAVGARSFLPF